MNETEVPKIEFPCDYPIKVIGDNGEDFQVLVIETVSAFVSNLDERNVTLNPSRSGNFVSVRLVIEATGVEQLKALHEALMATGRVKMVI